MTDTTTEPRVWIGCLACYNAGRLVGQWIDADEAGELTPEALHVAVSGQTIAGQTYVAGDPCPHEELWVMDHEGFGGMLTGECSPAEAQRMAELLAQVDEPMAFAAFVENMGRHYASQDWEATVDQFGDAYCGEWDTEKAYAQDLADDICPSEAARELTETWPFSCIDWEEAARELFMGDNWSASAPGGVYVFRSI